MAQLVTMGDGQQYVRTWLHDSAYTRIAHDHLEAWIINRCPDMSQFSRDTPYGDKPDTCLVKPDLWYERDQAAAIVEGWALLTFREPGKSRICRVTHETAKSLGIEMITVDRPFVSDLQAAEYVIERMHQGNPLAERAWRALMKTNMHGSEE